MPATPADLPAWIVVGLLTEEVVRRAPAAYRNPRSRVLWLVFLALDASMITKIEAVGNFLYRLTGVDDAATLAKHLAGIAAVALLLRWVTDVVPGRMDGRREPTYRRLISSNPRRITTWAAIVVITALFPFAQRRTGNAEDSDFIFVQAGHVWGSLHLLLFYTYLIFGLVCAALMCADAAHASSPGPFKYGMQGVALGCGFGALYGVLRSGYLIVRLADKPFLGGDHFVDLTSNFSLLICIILVVVGVTAPKLERLNEAVKAHGAINDLRPMWISLTDAVPTAIYDASPHRRPRRTIHLREYWDWRDLDTRLRRRVNEILDACLNLAAYVSPEDHDKAVQTGRTLNLPDHTVAAFLLTEAIRLKREGVGQVGGAVAIQPLARLNDSIEPLVATNTLLPVGRAMRDTAQLGLMYRRLSIGSPA